MNRAMFSGVAGLKTHQYKLDVIGNNVANVNTYGYKSQRAVFSDIYYQSLRGASQGTANRGGTNPSMIGYGSSLLGIQSQMTQSSMQNTGFGLDVAIAGEGYFQVMDPDGNIFYTKAGMLSYDSEGYLVDINGNFVLGTQDAQNGNPDTQKIKLDNAGAVPAARPTFETEIDGRKWTLSAANATTKGNIGISIASSEALPIGKKAEAVISGGSISILLNAQEIFSSDADLNSAINDAIVEANGGKTHAAGQFTLTSEPAFAGSLTGAQVAGVSGGYDKGSIKLPTGGLWGGFQLKEVGNDFAITPGQDLTFSLTRNPVSATNPEESFTVTATGGGKTYTNKILASQMNTPGSVMLTNNNSTTDTITLTYPTYSTVMTNSRFGGDSPDAGQNTAVSWTMPTPNDPWTKAQFANGEVYGGLNITAIPDDYDFSKVTINSITYTPDNTSTDRNVGEFSVAITIPSKTAGGTALTDTLKFTTNQLGKPQTTANGVTFTAPSLDNFLGSATAGVFFNSEKVTNDNIKNSEKSPNLGLASKSFALTGGTEGGPVTLDELTSISIGTDGTVSVFHPDKGLIESGKISIATFANPNGLQQEGNNYFSESLNSGEAVLAEPGTNGTGALKSSSLEMSNVDLAEEFSHMITTQRGFQANSRIITVSDTMLEELINLKR